MIRRWPLLLLLLLTLGLYQPSIGFGFFWDDPIWYNHVVEKTWLEAIQPQPDYQFYRPGTLLFNWFFARPDGTFPAPVMHQVQLWLHLLVTCMAYALARRLGLARRPAFWAAALVALAPLSYQAVAWAAPQQPLLAALMLGALLLYLAVLAAGTERRQWLRAAFSLLLFAIALTVQESAVPLSLLPLALSVLNGTRRRRRSVLPDATLLALSYPAVAAAYTLLWLRVPRLPGYTALGLDERVLAYLSQAFTYPVFGRPGGYGSDADMAPRLLIALSICLVFAALAVAHSRGRGRVALLGVMWAGLTLLPAAAGLDYSYVQLGSRLFYPTALGTGLLWAAALTPSGQPATGRLVSWPAVISIGILTAIVIQGAVLIGRFDQLYAPGAAQLARLVNAAEPAERMLVVNFPDRYAPKRSPYPQGYWGVTLAPVSVDLAEFVRLSRGIKMATVSRSMPWIDGEAREAGPYTIDMRGEIVQPEAFWALLPGQDAVYLSRYDADGTFWLERAGHVKGLAAPGCQLALFGGVVCLHDVRFNRSEARLEVGLIWSLSGPVDQHDTIFLHLGEPGQPPVAQADGHPMRALAPLWSWEPGVLVEDTRTLLLPPEVPSGALIKVGVYDWVTGERLPATTPEGEPLAGDLYAVVPAWDQIRPRNE